MNLRIDTDEEFDRALEWLCTDEKLSKRDVIREAVLTRYRARQRGFAFGALRHLVTEDESEIERELKEIDEDHDLN